MKEGNLRRVLSALAINEVSQPNAAGWMHASCPFAPWKHRSGKDTSKGFAIKVEDNGISAYSCPVCKMHGRIEHLARELGKLRQMDYRGLIEEISMIETTGAMMVPRWEDRQVRPMIEPLPDPLDPVMFDPMAIFDDVDAHPEAVQYLAVRRISRAAVEKATIRFDPDKRRIVFPVWDTKGNLYGMTGRTVIPNHHPKVLDYAGLPKRSLILGAHRWEPGRKTVIVEGLFAYARFLTEGVDAHYNVGALLGSEMTPGKAAILKAYATPGVYLILDPDPAGDAGIFGREEQIGVDRDTGEPITRRKAETGAAYQLIDHKPVYAPAYPEGVMDPDDLTLDHIVAMVEGAEPIPYHVAKPKQRRPHRK